MSCDGWRDKEGLQDQGIPGELRNNNTSQETLHAVLAVKVGSGDSNQLYSKLCRQRCQVGAVDYFLTQLFTGYGYLSTYLPRMEKWKACHVSFFYLAFNDAHHTFFECDQWVWERQRLKIEIDPMTPDNNMLRWHHQMKGLCKGGDRCEDGFAAEEVGFRRLTS